jgi:hypothetical protein
VGVCSAPARAAFGAGAAVFELSKPILKAIGEYLCPSRLGAGFGVCVVGAEVVGCSVPGPVRDEVGCVVLGGAVIGVVGVSVGQELENQRMR